MAEHWHPTRRLYVAEFQDGVVKVGISTKPHRRVAQMRRLGARALRSHVCDQPSGVGFWAEQELIARMGQASTVIPGGREWFMGINFSAAVALADQVTSEAQAKFAEVA